MVSFRKDFSFQDSISMKPPFNGIERDDNRIEKGDLVPPANMLYAMNVPSIPDRDYLIKYPQGLWSGKSIASDNDFRHIDGWGSNISFTKAQDEKAIQNLGQQFQRYSAHIPNIKEAECELEGKIEYNPYTSHGRSDAGRENARLHDIVQVHAELTRAGVPRHSLLHLESRVNALALREARAQQQKEAIAGFSTRRMVHVGSNRLAWQTSILPGHPLHTKGSIKGRKTHSNYLNLNPDPEGKVEELVKTGSYQQTGSHLIS
jgi:hypothetical protein